MKCTLSISLGNPSDLPEKPDSNLEFLASQNSVLKGGGVGALAYAHKPHLKGPHVHKGRPRWLCPPLPLLTLTDWQGWHWAMGPRRFLQWPGAI